MKIRIIGPKLPVSHLAAHATFRYARHHQQDWLLAIECLDLALLVDPEDTDAVRRGHVKADDIAHVVDEQPNSGSQLERPAPVRLQTERHPHSTDRGVGIASFHDHRADQPVRHVG
ncbi:hypothetical protein JQ569_39535 [Bradyrhizobium elkanii]|nr:hypothetical protein [Bradyrhizobium elkanii]